VQPFKRQPLPQLPPLNRALRLPDPAAAEVAVVNLFAAAERVRNISAEDLATIAGRYRLEGPDTPENLAPAGRSVFAQLLAHYVADGEVSDDEVEALVYLKELFALSNPEARELHDDAAAERYRAALDTRLEDREFSDADRAFLDQLRNRLLLSEERARQVGSEGAHAILLKAECEATAGLTLSPTDLAAIEGLAQNLRVAWPAEVTDAARVERLRAYWALDQLTPPSVEVDFVLNAGEIAHLVVPRVRWREVRRMPDEVEGETFFTVVSELIRWFDDSLSQRARSGGHPRSDDWFTVDRGTLSFTNQRLVFAGRRRTKAVPLSDIREVERQAERLSLKVKGRPWPMVFEATEELTAGFVLLRRLIREDIAKDGE